MVMKHSAHCNGVAALPYAERRSILNLVSDTRTCCRNSAQGIQDPARGGDSVDRACECDTGLSE